MRVLITGCGAHSKSIIDSLKNNENNEPMYIVGINASQSKMLKQGVDKTYLVPLITHPNYIEIVINICLDEKIDVVLPYITSELSLLAKNKHLFEKVGVKVSVSDSETIRISNDKIELHKIFPDLMPNQKIAYCIEDTIDYAEELGYPTKKLCVKLSDKCGGAGFSIVDDKKANDITLFNRAGFNRYISFKQLLDIVAENDVKIIMQEYIDGLDYSVVVLADGNIVIHKLGYVGYDMEFGAVINGEVIKNQQAYDMVDKIVNKLRIDGNACFDFILHKDETVTLLEINPRINASLSLAHAAGINFPYLQCKRLLHCDIPTGLPIRYGLKMNKYYESKYYI